MFDVRSDERLNAIQHRAGFIALLCYFGVVFILAILMLNVEGGVLHDPHFVLAVPFALSMVVFAAMLLGKGVFRTIRDEANKSPQQTRETRLRLLLGTVLFAATMFLIKHFDIFDHDTATLETDLLTSCGMAVVFGLYLWFTQARKVRGEEE